MSSALLASVMSAGVVPAAVAAAPVAADTKADKGPSAKELGEAKKHFDEGEKAFNKGDAKEALEHFKAAEAIKAAPATTRYIALCLDRLGHFRDAAVAFESFIAAAHGVAKPKKNLPKQIEEAEARLAEIKKLPAKLHISATPEGTVFKLDDQPAEAKVPADVEVKPGKHTVHFEAADHVATSVEVDASFAETKDVATALEKKAAPPPAPVVEKTPEPPPPPTPPAPPAEPRSKVPAYVTGGLALASVGLGTAFGVLALKDKSDFDKNLNNPTLAEEIANRGDNRALVADMAFAAALTLGVTSLVLFLTKDETVVETKAAHAYTIKKAAKKVPVIVPIATPNGGGAGAVFRF